MHPETFLRVLGPDPYRVGFVQPSRRPADGRYGENPNRLYKHSQFQVILKPSPADVQDVYLKSLGALGIDLNPISVELTYGLERICAFLQGVESVYALRWSADKTYGDIRLMEEQQLSEYSFDRSDAAAIRAEFELHEKQAKELLDGFKGVG